MTPVLTGRVRLHVRDICRQVCRENDVEILRGVLSSDHVHMFVSVPPKLAISDLVRKMPASTHRMPARFREVSGNPALVVLVASDNRADRCDDWRVFCTACNLEVPDGPNAACTRR